jgi:hypothetical protein
MHQQIRTLTSKVTSNTPSDLEELLRVLRDAHVNIIAAGGSDVEAGGTFAFAVEDGLYDGAYEALQTAGYAPDLLDVDHELLADVPGALHAFVTRVAAKNRHRGFVIKDVSIGTPHGGKILAQIYSEPAS